MTSGRGGLVPTAALALILLPTALPAQAPCDPADPTTAGVLRCASERHAAAEADLAALVAEYAAELDGTRAALLAASQDRWSAYRAEHCRFVASVYEGGSLQPVLRATCFAELTEARVAELRRQLEAERGP